MAHCVWSHTCQKGRTEGSLYCQAHSELSKRLDELKRGEWVLVRKGETHVPEHQGSTAPTGHVWFCGQCRRILIQHMTCCDLQPLLITADGIKRDSKGRIVEVSSAEYGK